MQRLTRFVDYIHLLVHSFSQTVIIHLLIALLFFIKLQESQAQRKGR